jgi:hypothetical protein
MGGRVAPGGVMCVPRMSERATNLRNAADVMRGMTPAAERVAGHVAVVSNMLRDGGEGDVPDDVMRELHDAAAALLRADAELLVELQGLVSAAWSRLPAGAEVATPTCRVTFTRTGKGE